MSFKRFCASVICPEPEPDPRFELDPKPLVGLGLCLLDLRPADELLLEDFSDFVVVFSTEVDRLELALCGFFLVHLLQFQMSRGSLASLFDTGGS